MERGNKKYCGNTLSTYAERGQCFYDEIGIEYAEKRLRNIAYQYSNKKN
jgi:hypothetical protein